MDINDKLAGDLSVACKVGPVFLPIYCCIKYYTTRVLGLSNSWQFALYVFWIKYEIKMLTSFIDKHLIKYEDI